MEDNRAVFSGSILPQVPRRGHHALNEIAPADTRRLLVGEVAFAVILLALFATG